MNQRGFATLTLLLLAPLIIAATGVVAAGYLILKADGQIRHLCRTQLLSSQAKISADLRDLMALNKVAASLRLEKRSADLEVTAASAFPPALPAANAHKASVFVRQLALAAQQKRLIFHAKLESKMAPAMTTREIYSSLTELRVIHSNDHLSLDFSEKTQSAAFEIVAQPRGNLTPDYSPSSDFERKQAMRVSWSFRASALLPAWIRPLVMSTGINAHGECSSTLKKGNQQWQPQLNADKS